VHLRCMHPRRWFQRAHGGASDAFAGEAGAWVDGERNGRFERWGLMAGPMR
jgi:hypothetical protein